MTESFKVAIVAQEYPPAVIQRLAGLLNTSPRKLAARLERSDLVVKKDVDESTAQQYAAVIYEKTGAEAIVLGGPDLSNIAVDKPLATKAESASSMLPRPLMISIGVAVCALLILLVVLMLRPGPEAALENAGSALQQGSTELFEQSVDFTALAENLYPTLLDQPLTRDSIGARDQKTWVQAEHQFIQSALQGEKLPTESTTSRVLTLLGMPSTESLNPVVIKNGEQAIAQLTAIREDLDQSYTLELDIANRDGNWQILRWLNASDVLKAIHDHEQGRLIEVNQAIEQELTEVLGEFNYQERIAGVHRFSLGQLLIKASLSNQNPQSIQSFSGEIFVYGVDSKHVYASKHFAWEAVDRLLPPGGSATFEAFYGLDRDYPDLLKALEKKAEKLEVGYRLHAVTFRDGMVLSTYKTYDSLRPTAD